MKVIDIVLLILLLIGGYRGYRKGLLIEIIGLAALIAAVIGGLKLMDWGMEVLNANFGLSGKWISILSFILIFIVIVLAISIIGKIMKNIVHLTLLGSVDNLAGAIFGILKWAFGLSIILWFFSAIGFSFPEETTGGAFIYPGVFGFAPKTISYLAGIFPFIGELFKKIAENFK